MKCPYCNSYGSFDNSNLNHIFKHNDEKCEKYFKYCYVCDTYFVDKNIHIIDEKIVEVKNIFDVDICNVCNNWIPDFPTSWIRSFTNVEKIGEVIDDIFRLDGENISSDDLMHIQRTHNGVIFNKSRAISRGIEQYILGSVKRRMNEYISFLLTSGVLKKNEGKITFTKFGLEFKSKENSVKLNSLFTMLFLNMKMSNIYQRNSSNSVYKYFEIHFVSNILEMLEYKRSKNLKANIYDFGVSLLARNKNQFNKFSLTYSDKGQEFLKEVLFNNDNLELKRGVISTFINCLVHLELINQNNKEYSISKLGREILYYIRKRPAIWVNDLDILSKILIWRLVKNNLISSDNLKIEISEIVNEVIEKISLNLNDVDDIQLNAYYDERSIYWNTNQKNTVIPYILHNYLVGFSDIELEDLFETLNLIWLNDIIEIQTKYADLFDNSAPILQSGLEWHLNVLESLRKLGFSANNYKDIPIYSGIEIPSLKIFLPGSTIYNPDILLNYVFDSEDKYVLVDAKDSNSLNSEVPKLYGYNLYATHVSTFCIIAVKGAITETTYKRIQENKSLFDRLTIIDSYSLDNLVASNLETAEIFELLEPKGELKIIKFDGRDTNCAK